MSQPIIGGPPIPGTPMVGCTAGNFVLYNNVQNSIDCVIGSEGPAISSLAKATLMADMFETPPFSCFLSLLSGQYSECGTVIPPALRKAAYDAFVSITGYTSPDVSDFLRNLNEQQLTIAAYNAFYIFVPILILTIIGIWLMVGFNWFDWPIGVFLTVIAVVILYGSSILYRLSLKAFIESKNRELTEGATGFNTSFADSLAYWPQGFAAAACAVTREGGTGGTWVCNDNPTCPGCPPRPLQSTSNKIKITKTGKNRLRDKIRPKRVYRSIPSD